jgi:hypothetical protein
LPASVSTTATFEDEIRGADEFACAAADTVAAANIMQENVVLNFMLDSSL